MRFPENQRCQQVEKNIQNSFENRAQKKDGKIMKVEQQWSQNQWQIGTKTMKNEPSGNQPLEAKKTPHSQAVVLPWSALESPKGDRLVADALVPAWVGPYIDI